MCPVKTENLALNVCRPEAEFWRRLAATVPGVRSRGDLQKNLLLAGLEKLNRSAARELRRIREMHQGKPARGVMAIGLLLLFVGTLFAHQELRRPARAVRMTAIRREVEA